MSGADFTTDYWATVVCTLKQTPVRCRVRLVDGHESPWAHPFFSPVPGYIEGGQLGPVPTCEVAWIDVESVEQRHRGRLVPDLAVDHSATLLAAFQQHHFYFERTEYGYRILASPVA